MVHILSFCLAIFEFQKTLLSSGINAGLNVCSSLHIHREILCEADTRNQHGHMNPRREGRREEGKGEGKREVSD